MGKLWVAILTGVIALGGTAAGWADDSGQLRKKIDRLEAENDALKDQVVKLKKELTDLRTKGKPEEGKTGGIAKTLSDRLPEGTVIRGDFVTTNMGKDNIVGRSNLTVSERKGNSLKGVFLSTADGKPNFEHEVSGMITGNSILIKSTSAPNPFTISGQIKDDYLTLQFTGPYTRAKLKLKVE